MNTYYRGMTEHFADEGELHVALEDLDDELVAELRRLHPGASDEDLEVVVNYQILGWSAPARLAADPDDCVDADGDYEVEIIAMDCNGAPPPAAVRDKVMLLVEDQAYDQVRLGF